MSDVMSVIREVENTCMSTCTYSEVLNPVSVTLQ